MSTPSHKRCAFITRNWQAMSDREMAQSLGVSKWTIIRDRQDMGIKRDACKVSRRYEAEIIAEYVKGGYVSRIARKLGIKDSTLRKAVKRICVRRPEVEERRIAAIRRSAITAILRKRIREKRRKALPQLRYADGTRKNTMLSARKYAALFDDPNERFLMVMRRRQEVRELLVYAANIPTDNKTEYNVVSHLLPYYQDLNRMALKLSRCVGQ